MAKLNYNLPKKLNKRVTIRQEGNTDDGMGGFIEGWSDLVTVWAGIRPRQADEFEEAEGIENEITHVVTIRYRTGIEPSMEVKYGAREFQILSVINPYEANRYLELVCVEDL